jgi:hypothetical protein
MRRRQFLTLLGGATTWPFTARAQQADRTRRIGMPVSGTESDPENQERLAAFREELNRFEWSEDNAPTDTLWSERRLCQYAIKL